MLTVAYGRPQYNYNPPQQSVPSGSYGAPGGFGGSAGGGSFGGSASGISTSGGGFGGGFGSSGSSASSGASSGGFSGALSSSGGSSAGGGGGGGYAPSGVASGGGVLVQKHIYVHVAPEEPEEFRPQKQIAAGQATKHYKIIFIKAPSAPAPTAPTIPLQAQNEEKTLVYVLVKKPDDAPEISIPTAAPTQPSKPEVYFIRYKTQKETTGGSSAIGESTGLGAIGSSISTGSSSTSISGGSAGRPAPSYGPPGQSGPY